MFGFKQIVPQKKTQLYLFWGRVVKSVVKLNNYANFTCLHNFMMVKHQRVKNVLMKNMKKVRYDSDGLLDLNGLFILSRIQETKELK